jgi:hypothetical protein
MPTQKRVRISVADLPVRDAAAADDAINRTLQRLGAAEGAACQQHCDCRIGLLCVSGVCTPKE